MKKIIVLLCLLFLAVGCSKPEPKVEAEKIEIIVEEVILSEDNVTIRGKTSESIDTNYVAYITKDCETDIEFEGLTEGEIVIAEATEVLESYPMQIYPKKLYRKKIKNLP